MSETLTGCEKTEPTSTKVPVEISTTRPKPGQITLKAPRRSILRISTWPAAVSF